IGVVLSGALRVPMTAVLFTVELTHDWNLLLPLLVGSVTAYAVSALMLKRSILTEKVARRGYHLIGEYSIDPLELLYVREVMRTKILVLSANMKLKEILPSLRMEHRQDQRLLPVVNNFGQLVGILTRKSIREKVEKDGESVHELTLGEIAHANAIEAF